MIYITSDLHFFHDRKFIYEPREFASAAEMADAYVREWKEKVEKQDDLYILGDFCMGTDYGAIYSLISSLPGKIHLIAGNHDTENKIDFYRSHGIDVKYADILAYKKRKLYLSHYPTITADLNQNPKNCVINLHGHLHVKERFFEDRPYMYNVSVDANENHFLTPDDILGRFEEKVKECCRYL